jgi:hypothetical protein
MEILARGMTAKVHFLFCHHILIAPDDFFSLFGGMGKGGVKAIGV